MHIYPLRQLVVLAVGLIHIQQTHAWGFYLIRESSSSGKHWSNRVVEGVKRCSLLSQRRGQRVTGIEIDQYAEPSETSIQEEDERWRRRATYIGFWADRSCQGLPRLIIHAYNEPDIRMTFRWAQLAGLVQGFPATSVRFSAWGEIPEGDALWPGLIPEGAVAVKRHFSTFEYTETDDYYLFENRLFITDLARAVVDLTRWDGFGGGTDAPPTVINLRGNQLTLPPVTRQSGQVEPEETSISEERPSDTTVPDPQLRALRSAVAGYLIGNPPPGFPQQLGQATSDQLQQIYDELGKTSQEILDELGVTELNPTEAQYNDLINELQNQQQLSATLAAQSNRAQMVLDKAQDPTYVQSQFDTLQALQRYWERDLRLPPRVLAQMLDSIEPLMFHEMLDQSFPDSLTVPEIAEFLRLKYFDDVGRFTQSMAGMDPLQYAQTVQAQNQMQGMNMNQGQNQGYPIQQQQQMGNMNMGQQGMPGSMMQNPYLGQGQMYILVPQQQMMQPNTQQPMYGYMMQNPYPNQNQGFMLQPQQQMGQQGGFQSMMQNPYNDQLQEFRAPQPRAPRIGNTQQPVPEPMMQNQGYIQNQNPTQQQQQQLLLQSQPSFTEQMETRDQNLISGTNRFEPSGQLYIPPLRDNPSQGEWDPNSPWDIPPFTDTTYQFRDDEIVAPAGTYEFNELLSKEEFTGQGDEQSMEGLIEVPVSTPYDMRDLTGHGQDVTDFLRNYPVLFGQLAQPQSRIRTGEGAPLNELYAAQNQAEAQRIEEVDNGVAGGGGGMVVEEAPAEEQ
ncbi:hypothetical protein Dda_2216 [Drechslerella dactyloides]|uniref:Uncharacterized protein n=1 Tax=Drechslerella dactyloides TaxID=74499 RepID=A0AAD6NNP6_DREDA|nr:hypothetical protein Dda_2216 [Drechslerella dactyloides]